MEFLQKIYESNKDSIIGSNQAYINNFRRTLINNYNLDKRVLQKNESTKHIDQKVLSSVNYHMKNSRTNFEILNSKSNSTCSINIKNGCDYIINNLNKSDVIFHPLKSHSDLLTNKLKYYNNLFKNDYVINLNSIFLNSGFEFILKENLFLKAFLFHPLTEIGSTIFAKNFFTLKKNSRLVLIEKFSTEVMSNDNVVNYFELEEGSQLVHLVIQSNENQSNLQFSSYANCHKNTSYNQFIFNCSNSSIRNHHYADMLGKNSEAKLQGVFFSGKNQVVDNKTLINHYEPNCSSNQTYKGILTDNAKASYLSKTFVDKIAQKTEGYQLSKGILLSEDAYFHSKPELKIYADDVKCSHGSTIGPFDYDKIFYLRSRGIDEKMARSLLIKSFYQDLLNSIEEKSYLYEIDNLVNDWLIKNIN